MPAYELKENVEWSPRRTNVVVLLSPEAVLRPTPEQLALAEQQLARRGPMASLVRSDAPAETFGYVFCALPDLSVFVIWLDATYVPQPNGGVDAVAGGW